MVMYDNEYNTKENKKYTKNKIEPVTIYSLQMELGRSEKDIFRTWSTTLETGRFCLNFVKL